MRLKCSNNRHLHRLRSVIERMGATIACYKTMNEDRDRLVQHVAHRRKGGSGVRKAEVKRLYRLHSLTFSLAKGEWATICRNAESASESLILSLSAWLRARNSQPSANSKYSLLPMESVAASARATHRAAASRHSACLGDNFWCIAPPAGYPYNGTLAPVGFGVQSAITSLVRNRWSQRSCSALMAHSTAGLRHASSASRSK
jgi:hypothetical protein